MREPAKHISNSSYARIEIEAGQIIKRYIFASGSTATLERRSSDLMLYDRTLRDIGFNIPASSIGIEAFNSGGHVLVIRQQYIEHPNALLECSRSSEDQAFRVVGACFSESIKLLHGLGSDRPVGYDISFTNFIVPNFNSAYGIDIYPPRLGFLIDSNGSLITIPMERRLLDYPESDPHSSEQIEARRRRFYYTQEGLVENLLPMAIASCFASSAAPLTWQETLNGSLGRNICSLLTDMTGSSGFLRITDHLKEYIKGDHIKRDLTYKLAWAWKMYRDIIYLKTC